AYPPPFSVPHGGRLDRKPRAAPGHIDLERHQLVGEGLRDLGAGIADAAAETVVQRYHVGLLQTVGRKSVRLSLAQMIGADILAGIGLMTGRAGEIELTGPQVIAFLAALPPALHFTLGEIEF